MTVQRETRISNSSSAPPLLPRLKCVAALCLQHTNVERQSVDGSDSCVQPAKKKFFFHPSLLDTLVSFFGRTCGPTSKKSALHQKVAGRRRCTSVGRRTGNAKTRPPATSGSTTVPPIIATPVPNCLETQIRTAKSVWLANSQNARLRAQARERRHRSSHVHTRAGEGGAIALHEHGRFVYRRTRISPFDETHEAPFHSSGR
jgi:hypothetical protein